MPHAGDLGLPVAAYILIILGLGLSALALPVGWALAAALSFICSDAILGWETFRLAPEHPARRLSSALIWPLYWVPQAGFFVTLG